MAEEGGELRPLEVPPATASLPFAGVVGRRYSFRARARDRVGNVEAAFAPAVTTRVSGGGCGCDLASPRRPSPIVLSIVVALVAWIGGRRRRRASAAAP